MPYTTRKVLDLSKVYQYGKVQLPKEVRACLNLKDGDKIIWYYDGEKVTVEKAI